MRTFALDPIETYETGDSDSIQFREDLERYAALSRQHWNKFIYFLTQIPVMRVVKHADFTYALSQNCSDCLTARFISQKLL